MTFRLKKKKSSFRKHGVPVHSSPFSMNFVLLFAEQSPKIGPMKIGKAHFGLAFTLSYYEFLAEMSISSIILPRRKKSNGVYQMIRNISFYLIGLSMNFPEKRNFCLIVDGVFLVIFYFFSSNVF